MFLRRIAARVVHTVDFEVNISQRSALKGGRYAHTDPTDTADRDLEDRVRVRRLMCVVDAVYFGTGTMENSVSAFCRLGFIPSLARISSSRALCRPEVISVRILACLPYIPASAPLTAFAPQVLFLAGHHPSLVQHLFVALCALQFIHGSASRKQISSDSAIEIDAHQARTSLARPSQL